MQDEKFTISYESLWKAIIRPPRDNYLKEELGQSTFTYFSKTYHRSDYEIVVSKGNIIKSSFIELSLQDRDTLTMPVIIYLHGNSSSRIEGLHYMGDIIKRKINLFVFDFAGCGKSEGEYISLGYHEKNDLKIIIDFVSKLPFVGKIGLWGHSMGAATSIIYSHLDDRVKCVCADSSFAKFTMLAKELCSKQINLPNIIVGAAIKILNKTIFKKNGLDLSKLNPIDDVKLIDKPIYFVHAMNDELINKEHTIELFEACPCRSDRKFFTICEGGHNSARPRYLVDKICNFFQTYLE